MYCNGVFEGGCMTGKR